MRSDVRYQSVDADALGPDEHFLFEVEYAARGVRLRSPRAIAARVAITLVAIAIVVVLADRHVRKGPSQDLAIVFPIAIGLVTCGCLCRDPLAVPAGARTTRVTDEGILQRGGAGRRRFTIDDAARVEIVRDARPASIVTIAGMAFDDDGSLPSIVAGFRTLVVRGIDGRASARRRRRAWRPIASGDTPGRVTTLDPDALADLALAPLDGEVILWAGRPTFARHAAIRRRLRSLRAAAPWAVAAGAAVAWPFCMDRHGGAPMLPVATVAAVIGGIVLFTMVHAQLLEPRRATIRLRRSRYVLTNLRVICRVVSARGVRETSSFFDDATQIDVALDPDVEGVGTVSIGYHTAFESIPDAKAVHALVVRAVAGARLGIASPVLDAARTE